MQHGDTKPWCHAGGGEISGIKNFYRAWRTACLNAGLGYKAEDGRTVASRIVHDLRRTAVRNLVRAGVPERVAMTMTGHKTRSVFERYSITSEGDLDRAADQLEARLEIERQRLAGRHNSGTISPLQTTREPSAARK